MKDFKFKSKGPQTKSFGYQVLGFGAGGGPPAEFVAATGGNTITTDGDFKVHTFTGPGTLCVSSAGNNAGSSTIDYLVVAGGGAGGNRTHAGGGGAGGYRASGHGPSPLQGTAITAAVQGYPITIGAGGSPNPSPNYRGNVGANSVFSTITSTGGGGGGGGGPGTGKGSAGGSGGGSGGNPTSPGCLSGAAGNTPPVSPP